MKLIIHTDGGSRGNPGEGAVGVVIEWKVESGERKVISEFGKRVGIVTNNEAEYLAVIESFKKLSTLNYQFSTIQFVMDSKLVCEQLSGRWKIKKEHLKDLFNQIKSLEFELGIPVSYTHVLRNKNKRADELLNQALDSG